MAWDKIERRKSNMHSEDHDTLVRIETKLEDFFLKVDAHIMDDKNSFLSAARKIEWLQKIAYGGIGAVVLIEFVSKFIIK